MHIAAYNIAGRRTAPFDPLTGLTNLRLALTADTLVKSVAKVTSWTDQSTVAQHFTPQFGANQPDHVTSGFNGGAEPYVLFNGSTWRLGRTSFSWGGAPTSHTVHIVYRDASTTAGNRVVAYGSTPTMDIRQAVAGPIYAIGATPANGAGAMSTARQVTVTYDGANMRLYVGGALNAGPVALSTTLADSAAIELASVPGGGAYSNVEIAAVYAMRGVVPSGELASLAAYCATRWGVA